MLKILLFVPCQKLIVGQDNSSSIISVIESIHVSVAPDVPETAALPMTWNVLTLWRRCESAPEPITYQQRIEGITENGKTVIEAEQDFVVSNMHVNMRNTLEVAGFPFGSKGTLNLRLLLRRKGEETWQLWAEFPIGIVHIPLPKEVIENVKQKPTA